MPGAPFTDAFRCANAAKIGAECPNPGVLQVLSVIKRAATLSSMAAGEQFDPYHHDMLAEFLFCRRARFADARLVAERPATRRLVDF
jgi:hypothetical protein